MGVVDDVSWPLAEQLVVDVDQRATDRAIEILEDAGPDRRVTVQRVLEYARGDRPSHEVTDADWVRAIEHSDGRLALVSWTSAGITEIGLKSDADESRRPFEVWMYSGIRDRMGDEPVASDDATRRGARQLLEHARPTIVPVWESHLRPEIVPDGGQSTTGTERNLTTTRAQVFGDVSRGTKCRVCGRPVDDGRAKVCSDYCGNLLSAVMGMLNWTPVRRKIIGRDDETCQVCGFDYSKERKAKDHIRALIYDAAGERPESPSLEDLGSDTNAEWENHHEELDAWNDRKEAAKERYGDPYESGRGLEVDHIVPVSEGGHPFDPANLQTLCGECHKDKTARENSERGQTPSRGDLSESLFTFVAEGCERSVDTNVDRSGGDER